MSACPFYTSWLTLVNTFLDFDRSKLKAFAHNKINVTEKLKSVLERVENIVGKGEIAGHQCFQKATF